MTPSIVESLRSQYKLRPGYKPGKVLVDGKSIDVVVVRGAETRAIRQAIYELGIRSTSETFWLYEFPIDKELPTGAELTLGNESWQLTVVTERRVDGELINHVVAATRHAD